MANKLTQFGRWLSRSRPFRVDWFAKDPQQKLAPEEALFNMPEALNEALVKAANNLQIPPREKQLVVDKLQKAIDKWRSRPQASANSLVVIADPVSSVSRILSTGLEDIESGLEQEKEDAVSENDTIDVNILDWVERPTQIKDIKEQIKDQLDLPGKDELGERVRSTTGQSLSQEKGNKDRALMVLPNLCWCFLRSADGLDGLDYLQDLLPRDRAQFWVIGSGMVGWEYLKSTLNFHAFCGELVSLPRLSGEDLQDWLNPLVEEFDIHFPDAALHKQLQDPQNLLDFNADFDKPIETFSKFTQEVSASVKASARALKDEILPEEEDIRDNTPKRDFFERLADLSDGVSEVALQLFIKSLRYREITQKVENPTEEDTGPAVVLKEASAPDSKKTQLAEESGGSASEKHSHKHSSSEEDSQKDSEKDKSDKKEYRLIATMPKLPLLPELTQDDLYLMYSLMLHGDMTVYALAKSLGDAPSVVTNQVQLLRNAGVVEQKERVLKVNPVHYPRVRRELSRNNFIIEVP